MPYKVIEEDSKYKVVKEDDGKVMGEHATRAKAEAQLRALYANEGDKSTSAKYGRRLSNNTQKILEQIRGLLDDLVGLETEEDDEEKSIPNLQALDLSYVKSLRIEIPENRLAAKYVGKNVIAHPVFIWGDATKTDLEADFFTKETEFWDKSLAGFARPLTWDHGQDKKFAQFEDNPVIGKTVKYFDDDLARWAESVIETDKLYRKYIDQFIEEKVLGYSSDSAPQYVQRVKQGKAMWIKSWPWFGGSLTVAPCEARMKTAYTPEYLKSLGLDLPDVQKNEWQTDMMILEYFKQKYK